MGRTGELNQIVTKMDIKKLFKGLLCAIQKYERTQWQKQREREGEREREKQVNERERKCVSFHWLKEFSIKYDDNAAGDKFLLLQK